MNTPHNTNPAILKQMIDENNSGSGVEVTAKPGQLIRVKEVDEKDKPTAWEAVPWGYTEGGMVEILPECQPEFVPDLLGYQVNGDIGIELGKTYTINWNGTEYECTTFIGEGYAFGNNAAAGGEDTGEPFVGVYVPKELIGTPESFTIFVPLDGSTNPTVSIYQKDEIVYKLPGELLPEGVPYVEKGGMVEILAECQPPYDEYDNMFLIMEGVKELSVGETYIVNWNGTEYTCVGQDMSAMMPGAVLLGDGSNFGLPSMGEPFMIGSALEDGIYALMVMPLDGTTELTISIYHNAEVVHKLDNRCLDLAWLPTIGFAKGEVLIPEQVPSIHGYFNNVNFTAINPDITNLLITVDGVEHLCTAIVKELTSASDGDYISLQCVTPVGALAVEYRPNNAAETFAALFPPSEATISIHIAEQGANRMPEEFLPDGVPYVRSTDTLTFDGNIEGKTAFIVRDGVYLVHISSEFVEATDLIGSTVQVTDLADKFEEDTFEITEDVITDGTPLGLPGYLIGEYILVMSEEGNFQGIACPKGISMMCMPGALWIREIKAPSKVFVEVGAKLHNACLDMDFIRETLDIAKDTIAVNLADFKVGVLELTDMQVNNPTVPSNTLYDVTQPIIKGAKVLLTFQYKVNNDYTTTFHGYVTNWEVDEMWLSATTIITLGLYGTDIYFAKINFNPDMSRVYTHLFKLPLATS